MNMWGRKMLPVFMALAMGVTAACSNSGANSGTAAEGNTDAKQPAQAQTNTDPLGKYATPITVNWARDMDTSFKFPEGQNIDNNVWYTEYEKELGIKIKNTFVATGDQYTQKVSIAMTTDDLPDMLQVGAIEFQQLIEGGMIEDLTAVFEKYGSKQLKDYAAADSRIIDTAKADGKLMGIPTALGNFDGSKMIWIRKSWLDKLGLAEPKSMQDIFNISEAFTKKDPDGNGKNDTYGLLANKAFYVGGYGEFEGFFNGFNAFPKFWIKDASGKLVYGSVQPQAREALLKLQAMFKDGQIDPEFAVKDSKKAAELLINGKIGMMFGANWNPILPLIDSMKKEPEAGWRAYPLMTIDGKPGKAQVEMTPKSFYVVKKGYKNPEALIKMINYHLNIRVNATKEQFDRLIEIPKGDGTTFEAFKYTPVFNLAPPDKNHLIYLSVNEALKSKDTSKLNPEMMRVYNDIQGYEGGNVGQWPFWRIHKESPNAARTIIAEYMKQNLFQINEFMGTKTPGMIDKQSTLDKMELEVFTKIVMGAPIEDFDKFVADWKKLGGDQITKEVNDWAAKAKK
ncbi:MAG: transporter substrate-binding protein [Paenibacillus sp.]|nr:transporter substrate-binding protein [Paenibacillus sp.]